MRLKTTIATTEPFDNCGGQMAFTDDDLIRMADSASGVPVTVDFNRDQIIGHVVRGEVVEGQLVCEIEIDEKPFGNENSCVVAGTIFNAEKQEHEKLFECSIVLNPRQVLPYL
jgi:hypothetical protein